MARRESLVPPSENEITGPPDQPIMAPPVTQRTLSPRSYRWLMTTPEHKNQVVLQGLIEHFTHSGEQQTPEQIADSTGLPVEAVEDALRALWTTHRIEGIDTAEAGFPSQVTGVPDV